MFTWQMRMIALAITITCVSGCSELIESSGIVLRDLDASQIVLDWFGQRGRVSVVDLIDPAK